MTASAMAIYQDFLDEMSAALLEHDAEAFARRIFLPHFIQTETDRIELETTDEILANFHGFANALAAQKVDSYIRLARRATFETDARIVGEHESFMTSGGTLVVPKFANTSVLELKDGIWGSTNTRHLARFVSWPDILPRFGDDA
ncbi:hypothetical protein A8B78_20795 [Jannaschia sp. EhC01]|nr:hypothetical protein A8B78_20795 [Jannaschia sp. EhC01]